MSFNFLINLWTTVDENGSMTWTVMEVKFQYCIILTMKILTWKTYVFKKSIIVVQGLNYVSM